MSSDHFSATTTLTTTSMNLFILLLLLSLNFSFFFLKVHAQEPNDLIFKSASSSSANLKATSQHSNGSQPLSSSSSSSSSGRPSPKTVLNISSQLSAGQCPPEFEGRCLCGMGAFAQSRPTYITNCTNAGFGVGKANKSGQTITSPSHYLQAIDNRTEVLIFTGNHFPELPANLLLLNRSYDQLHTVDLSNNNISTIHGKAFHNMRSVRVLYLNDNRLRITGAAAAQADLTNKPKPKPKPAKVHHHHHGGRRVNPMAIIIGDRGDGSVGGSSVQDGVDMSFNSEDDDDDDDDDQSEPDEIAPTTSDILERQSPHPRMFSPLRSLEQLHLRNAFEMRERTSSQHGKKKALFAADSDDGAIENDKASLALVAALGEVFRKSNVSTLKLLNLEANGLTSFEKTSSSSSSSSSSLSFSSSSFFCALPRLQHLQLAYNRLSGYPVNGSCLRWLSTVDLTGNRIQTMDARSMALIRSSGPALGALHLNFARNPFRCDCALLPFFRFLTAANSETADPRQSPKFEALPEYRCYLHSSKGGGGSGNDIVGQYFDDLNEADFGDCGSSSKSFLGVSSLKTESGGLIKEGSQEQNEKSEAIRRYRHYITLSYIVLAILLLLLAFLLAVLAYTNRTWILSTWNYFLLEMNYPKSDYTALDAKGDNGGGGGSSRGDEDDGDGDQIEQDLANCQPTVSANNLDDPAKTVNGNKANGLQQKKGSNKGKTSKKFGNRQSSGSNSAANRSNHIRMRELKNGHDASVAEEQV